MIFVDYLLRLVRRGTWETLWREYVDVVMKKSFVVGCLGILVVLYVIVDIDLFGFERFGGLFDLFVFFDGLKEYLKFLF